MHGISSLERHHGFPAPLRDLVSNLAGGTEGFGEIGFEITQIKNLNRAREHSLPLRFKGRHPGVCIIVGAVHGLTDLLYFFIG